MRKGSKVRCKYIAKDFKQPCTPSLRVGWVYLIEAMKIEDDLLGISLAGLKKKKDGGNCFFAADCFEMVPDAEIFSDARAGLLKRKR